MTINADAFYLGESKKGFSEKIKSIIDRLVISMKFYTTSLRWDYRVRAFNNNTSIATREKLVQELQESDSPATRHLSSIVSYSAYFRLLRLSTEFLEWFAIFGRLLYSTGEIRVSSLIHN
jgi:hypothetical protein